MEKNSINKNSALFKKYSYMVEDLYNTYSFLNMPKNEFVDSFISALQIVSKKDISDVSFENYLSIVFKNQIKRYIIDKYESVNYKEILMNYINSRIKEVTDIDDIKNQLSLINEFAVSFSVYIKDETIDYIIKNLPLINKYLNIIYNRYKDIIISGEYEYEFDDMYLNMLIEKYASINNLEIGTDKEIDINAFKEYMSKDDIDLVNLYLNEISQYPLLKPEEEIKLGYQILEGNLEAKNMLVERNLRLVVKVSKRYLGSGLPFLDLIQEGNLGLMNAAEKFDVRLGYKFSTYALWWINQAIIRGISLKAKSIRLPLKLRQLVTKFDKIQKKLESEFNRELSSIELAELLDVDVSSIDYLIKYKNDTTSLNKVVSQDDEKGAELGDFVPADTRTPEEETVDTLKYEGVRRAINECKLNDREKDIIYLRFGFNGNEPHSLEEIASKYNITRESVRQIERVALKKIYNNRNFRNSLKGYEDEYSFENYGLFNRDYRYKIKDDVIKTFNQSSVEKKLNDFTEGKKTRSKKKDN